MNKDTNDHSHIRASHSAHAYIPAHIWSLRPQNNRSVTINIHTTQRISIIMDIRWMAPAFTPVLPGPLDFGTFQADAHAVAGGTDSPECREEGDYARGCYVGFVAVGAGEAVDGPVVDGIGRDEVGWEGECAVCRGWGAAAEGELVSSSQRTSLQSNQ